MKKADDGNVLYITGAPSSLGNRWKTIDWMKVEEEVKRLQIRIAEAANRDKNNKVKYLQRILTRSYSARLLAVKRVSSSRGSSTPGIDRILWKSPAQKMRAALNLHPRGYKAKPLRRITIPKKNGKKRKLGIPTLHDRAMQALYLLALEPAAETSADPNSYGFRPKRGCRDAIAQCFLSRKKLLSSLDS
jgi:RNA-directed DNA polymerase